MLIRGMIPHRVRDLHQLFLRREAEVIQLERVYNKPTVLIEILQSNHQLQLPSHVPPPIIESAC